MCGYRLVPTDVLVMSLLVLIYINHKTADVVVIMMHLLFTGFLYIYIQRSL